MSNNMVKKILKKRIFGSLLDVFLYLTFSILSFLFLLKLFNVSDMRLYIPYGALFYILYYAIIPKLTRGYTLGGFVFGVRIVKLSGSSISVLEYFIRSLCGALSYLVFFGYLIVKTNTAGQLYYDKLFDTTVVDRNMKLPISTNDTSNFTYYFLAE